MPGPATNEPVQLSEMEVGGLARRLPTRYPFVLVDRIVDFDCLVQIDCRVLGRHGLANLRSDLRNRVRCDAKVCRVVLPLTKHAFSFRPR